MTMTATTTKKETLLSKIGGQDALRAAVDEFYLRLMNDETLQPFFVGVNIKLLKWHQHNFMSIAFTEIPSDLDVGMLIHSKHQRLFMKGLNENHFDTVAGHFVAQHLQVPANLIDEAVKIVVPLRPVFQEGAAKAKEIKDKKKYYFIAGTIAAIAVATAGVLVFLN